MSNKNELFTFKVDWRGSSYEFHMESDQILLCLQEFIEATLQIPIDNQKLVFEKDPAITRRRDWKYETLKTLELDSHPEIPITIKLTGSTKEELEASSSNSVPQQESATSRSNFLHPPRSNYISSPTMSDGSANSGETSPFSPSVQPSRLVDYTPTNYNGINPFEEDHEIEEFHELEDEDMLESSMEYQRNTAPVISTSTSSETNFGIRFRDLLPSGSESWFFEGPFSDAFDAAKRESKILFCLLYSSADEATTQFVTQMVTSDFIMEYVKLNMIMWCGNAQNSNHSRSLLNMINRNPQLVEQLSFVQNLPTSALIAYIEGSISLVDVMHGPDVTLDQVYSKLLNATEIYAPLLDKQTKEQPTRNKSNTQLLHEEQDERYREALRRDEERQKQKELEKKKAEEEKNKRDSKAAEFYIKLQNVLQKRKEWRSVLTEQKVTEIGPEDKTIVLKLRLPDSEVMTCKLRLEKDSIRNLFYLLECEQSGHIYPQRNEKEELEEFLKLEDVSNYQHLEEKGFVLKLNYPNKTFTLEKDGHLTLKEAFGNTSQAQLFVQLK